MATTKILFFLSLVFFAMIFPKIADAQTATLIPVQELNDNSAPENKMKNIDLAPQQAETEKPHVIGDDGQKIFFLSDPSSTTSNEKGGSEITPVAAPLNKSEENLPVVKPE